MNVNIGNLHLFMNGYQKRLMNQGNSAKVALLD